jgi:phage shock protein C
MIRITGLSSFDGLQLRLQAAPRTKFASVRRLSMLRCNIALAACGGNSQLSGRGRGGTSQLTAVVRTYSVENTVFSSLARLMLRGEHSFTKEFDKMSAQEDQVALPLRNHTILGVCEAIGEDFGFNPIFLRVPLAAMVIVNATWAFGAYFGLGAIVLASRLLFPDRKASTQAKAAQPTAAANEQNELAKAA